MSAVSIPKKCTLCGEGELSEWGYTAFSKGDLATKTLDHSKLLITRILVCNQGGHLVLFKVG